MTGFPETHLAVAVIAIGIVFGGIVVLTVSHTIALLLWMWRHGETLPAKITDLVETGQSGKGGTVYALEAEFEYRGETRRICTRSVCQFGMLFEKRRAQKKLERWQSREAEILYCPAIPEWLAVKGPREAAYVKGMIWRDVLFAGGMAVACVVIAIRLIL